MDEPSDIDELDEMFESTAAASDPAAPKGEVAVDALGAVLIRPLTKHGVCEALARRPQLIIVKVENASFAEIVGGAIHRRFDNVVVKVATERHRSGGVHHRVGGTELGHLQKGRLLVMVSQDPDGILDEAALATADRILTIPPLTPKDVQEVIRRVAGGVVRGVTPAMARLDAPAIVASVRPGLSARECVSNLRRAVERLTGANPSSVPLLPDLPLTENVRAWADELVLDLQAVKAGTLSPGNLVFCLLAGPPGTGKSLIAESIARTADWNYVSATVGSWFAVGDGALGGVARNLRAFVDQVLANEPCIGLLDEIDALPDRATLDSRNREWWLPVITLFLTEVDRVRKSGKKVLLLGATNYGDRLDSALIRPGRLHRRVPVLAPETEEEVSALFRYFLRGDLADVDLGKLTKLAQGATPADVEGWLKEARNAARIKGRALELADIQEQMAPKDDRSPQDIRAIAIHEIGHAIVSVMQSRASPSCRAGAPAV